MATRCKPVTLTPDIKKRKIPMNPVKKILIIHQDPKIKRRLVIMLADAGYDLRAFVQSDAALEAARTEWFDLALVDADPADKGSEFAVVDALKKVQPTVPIVVVVAQLELPLIVKGIKMGLTDVLPAGSDLRPLLRRINSILRPNQPPSSSEDDLTAKELSEAEAVLQLLGNPSASTLSRDPFNTSDVRLELANSTKDRAELEEKLTRLSLEKTALEAELKTLLDQQADATRIEAERADLGIQREKAATAQQAIDQKAQILATARQELLKERTALEDERRKLNESASQLPAAHKDEAEIARERSELEHAKTKLLAEENRLREEATRLQQEASNIAQERRRWHEDLDLLRVQESNLREYENRLRQLQAQLEADRVNWFSARHQSNSPFQDDAALTSAWEKLQRATELLEAERAVFRDDRLAAREHEADLKRREAKLQEQLAKIAPLASKPTAQPFGPSLGNTPAAMAAAAAAAKASSQSPFEKAKSFLLLRPRTGESKPPLPSNK